jgi:hypothetical protein
MAPFQLSDLDAVVTLAFEYTAGALAHVVDEPSSERLAAEWEVAFLRIFGPWQCAVSLAIEPRLAEALTLAMGDIETATLADVHDAIGELANVVAGGVKGMTPVPGCDLSIPEVLRSSIPAVVSASVMRRFYSCGGSLVCLTVTL